MNSPPKKKQKTELSYIDKAFMVKTLIKLRENKEKVDLYRTTLQHVTRISGNSVTTILNWMKPKRRDYIYYKANEMLSIGGELKDMIFGDMSLDTNTFLPEKFSLNNDDSDDKSR